MVLNNNKNDNNQHNNNNNATNYITRIWFVIGTHSFVGNGIVQG